MRLINWRARLARYLALQQDSKMQWGVSDCALFAAGGVEAVTGADLAADWRGTYSSRAEAMDVLRSLDCRDVADLADLHLERHDRPSHARPGDIALVESDAIGSLAIVAGPALRVRAVDSIGTLPLSAAMAAWRAG